MMNKNDITTVTITDIGTDGEGIGKVDGYTLFVKDAVVGDTVEVKIMKAKKNYAYARLQRIIEPSKDRVTPRCELAGPCGGCQIQALDYDAQLRYKANKVRNNLIRLGGFDEALVDSVMQPIVGMDNPYEYRNKAQFPFGKNKEGKTVCGFYAGRTHSIIAGTDCALGVADNKQLLEDVLEWMERFDIQPYDEEHHKGLIRHVLIRKGFTSGELMVCIVANLSRSKSSKNESILPHQAELIESLTKNKSVKSISVSFNSEKTNVIMGTDIVTIYGDDTISDVIHLRDVNNDFAYVDSNGAALDSDRIQDAFGIKYNISPLSFYQVNPVQTEKLYSLALDYADLTGNEAVWDLYCGIGTISLFLAGRAGKVIGVEIIPQAIEDAKQNALNNNITNAEFYVGRAEEVLPAYYASEEGVDEDMLHPDVIVVDPPRKGCDEACLDTMLRMRPSRIVYVSCDSATLARDLKILCDGGYELKKVRPVDQFPHTVHVECACLLGDGPFATRSVPLSHV